MLTDVKMSPNDRWVMLRTMIAAEIDLIDEATKWQPSEPDWWLQMMHVRRELSHQPEVQS